MFAQGSSVAEIAERIGADGKTVRRWLDRAGADRERPRKRKGAEDMAEKEDREGQGEWARAWGELPDDPEERARVAEVRLAEALAVLDVLKAPGPGSLSNMEKHRAGRAARAMTAKAGIDDVLADFRIARSTYFSQGERAARPDKYAALRKRVKAVFEDSKRRYGSSSIWAKLRSGEGGPVRAAELAPGDASTPVAVSEKVVRRIMAEEGLRARAPRAARYSSYAGEEGRAAAPNLLLVDAGRDLHDFSAAAPGEVLVTDITEFRLPDDPRKVYLSPAVDLFDGDVAAFSVGTSPSKALVAEMLAGAVAAAGGGFTLHSDRGWHYRTPDWVRACGEAGVERSMSRKGHSPDNAACEGFFGRLKVEFFHGRDWRGVSAERFAAELAEWIRWYREGRLKAFDEGGRKVYDTIAGRRRRLGLAA